MKSCNNERANSQRNRRTDRENANWDEKHDQESENRVAAKRRDSMKAPDDRLGLPHDLPDSRAGSCANGRDGPDGRNHNVHLDSVRVFA